MADESLIHHQNLLLLSKWTRLQPVTTQKSTQAHSAPNHIHPDKSPVQQWPWKQMRLKVLQLRHRIEAVQLHTLRDQFRPLITHKLHHSKATWIFSLNNPQKIRKNVPISIKSRCWRLKTRNWYPYWETVRNSSTRSWKRQKRNQKI